MTQEIMMWVLIVIGVFTEALIVTVVMNTKKLWDLEATVAAIKRTLRLKRIDEEEAKSIGINPFKTMNVALPEDTYAILKTSGARQEPTAPGLWEDLIFNMPPMPKVKPIRKEAPPGKYISPVKLDDGKLYYLAHPCTSGGRTMAENKKREDYLYRRIMDKYPNAKIIRPLALIPDGLSMTEAMAKCFKLLSACDGGLFPVGWQKSGGCCEENRYCEEHTIEIIYLGV